jgi:hypothetical protein
MEQQYFHELFGFRIKQRKLANFAAKLFVMEPTAAGAKTLNSYELRFKAQDSGFVLAAPCIRHLDTGLAELKNPFVGSVKLAFAGFTQDRRFRERSDLPLDPPGEYVYYFNNLNPEERRTKLLLNKCVVKASERVSLHTKQFRGIIAKDPGNGIIRPRVFDCRGSRVSETQYDFIIDEYQNSYTISLARMEDGLYTVEYNGDSLTCYCAKASFIRRIPLLILEIFTDPDIAAEYRVTKTVNGVLCPDSKSFSLYFGSNAYYWRYKIIPINVPASTWLQIKTDRSGYSFDPDKVKINISQDHALFTSREAIDIPDDELTVNLYRLVWNNICRPTIVKNFYCNSDFWLARDGEYWCRQLDQNILKYKCPARYEDAWIGALPQPGGETTLYYNEAEKAIAQLSLYLVYENGKYLIKDKYEPPAPGDFTHVVLEDEDDVTIRFINKVSMSYVILYYYITDKIGQQSMYMNKFGNLYQMENIVERFFPQSKILPGDQIVYWFTYELISNKKVYTSDKFTHIFKSSFAG